MGILSGSSSGSKVQPDRNSTKMAVPAIESEGFACGKAKETTPWPRKGRRHFFWLSNFTSVLRGGLARTIDLGEVRVPRKRNLDVAGGVTGLGRPIQLPDDGHRRPFYRAQYVVKYVLELPERLSSSEDRA